MATVIIIKLIPEDGEAAPKYVSDISNGQLQLLDAYDAGIAYQWPTSSFSEDDANEMVDAVVNTRAIVAATQVLSGSTIICDAVEVV